MRSGGTCLVKMLAFPSERSTVDDGWGLRPKADTGIIARNQGADKFFELIATKDNFLRLLFPFTWF